MEQLDFFNTLEQNKTICPVCGNTFDKNVNSRKYCSKKCFSKRCRDTNRINRRKSVNGLKKFDKCECQNCGKEFIKLTARSMHCSTCIPKAQVKRRKEKRNILKNLKTYDKCICPTCGNSFDKTTHNKKCCSRQCTWKKYEQENKDKILTRRRLKNLNRPDRFDFLVKKRENNKKYRDGNLGKRRSYEREKIKKDPIFKFKKLTRCRIAHEIKRAGNNKSYKMVDLLGCTALEAKEHIEKQFKEGMTWDNHGRHTWHIDHIIPCASFDLTDPEQQKKCFHYTNLQPLWAEENMSKGAKIL